MFEGFEGRSLKFGKIGAAHSLTSWNDPEQFMRCSPRSACPNDGESWPGMGLDSHSQAVVRPVDSCRFNQVYIIINMI
jgi:hypothetical protein